MNADLRLAWLLTRGSNRREWWRAGLTAVGAGLATGFGLAAVAIASIEGQYVVSFGNGLLNQPGERTGVVFALVLLLIPVLGFLGQCARVGAVHRDRRLAALRLAGAAPGQVRRIAALEAGLACLVGSVIAVLASVAFVLGEWKEPPGTVWAAFVLVAVAVPVLGALVSALALRRVITSPLGWVRRVRTTPRPGLVLAVIVPTFAVLVLLTALTPYRDNPLIGFAMVPLTVVAAVVLVGVVSVWLSGFTARLTGRYLAARTESPAVLIAAERLRDDPWAAARTHAAVLLVTVVGTGFVGVRQGLLAHLHGMEYPAENMSFYETGLNLTAAAILVALAITLCALAVGTAESLATRRRGLAAQTAAGVPRAVLGRALLLETALPLAPALLLAGLGGLAIGVGYGGIVGDVLAPSSVAALLVPLAVYATCLLAAATSLPLLRRSAHPGELRYT
ncbi:FtsX-like permease family protein [Streptomyces sp. GESEQ-4]|uniref:FtsX-like permease family protein n=1 Tax=Streptomyces sp. GESEQ-4 TaxID=2812655 RepID=UPI001B322881|nr:FtsX-like permease family protein [Streptomyces sp. GESEQ-4]